VTKLATLAPSPAQAIPVESFVADVEKCSGIVDVVLEGAFRHGHHVPIVDGCGGPYLEHAVILRKADDERSCRWPLLQ
jgi:hypothetical protein